MKHVIIVRSDIMKNELFLIVKEIINNLFTFHVLFRKQISSEIT